MTATNPRQTPPHPLQSCSVESTHRSSVLQLASAYSFLPIPSSSKVLSSHFLVLYRKRGSPGFAGFTTEGGPDFSLGILSCTRICTPFPFLSNRIFANAVMLFLFQRILDRERAPWHRWTISNRSDIRNCPGGNPLLPVRRREGDETGGETRRGRRRIDHHQGFLGGALGAGEQRRVVVVFPAAEAVSGLG